jgi:predicted LPLAT superfamily acyltransferase
MQFTVWIYRRFGLGLATVLAWPAVAYFVLTDARGRRASRRYLERLAAWAGSLSPVPARSRFRDTFRHYWEFGLSILDRLSLWSGRTDFRIQFHGRHHFQPLLQPSAGRFYSALTSEASMSCGLWGRSTRSLSRSSCHAVMRPGSIRCSGKRSRTSIRT